MDNPQTPQDQPAFETTSSAPNRSSRKALVLTLLAVTVLVVAGALYYLLQRNADTTTGTDNPSAVAEISPEAGVVEIRTDGVWPQTIKVKAGQQVTFINKDTTSHKLVANEDVLAGFDSVDMLATGDSYTYVFDTPGTYSYYDPADGVKYSGTVEVN